MTYRYTGSAHPFYQYGESYTLHIKRIPTFSRVLIWVERGKESVINQSYQRYKNWEAFLKDWTNCE